MSYDQRCLDLAEYFLTDESKRLQRKANELAQAIQDAVEDWFQREQDEADA